RASSIKELFTTRRDRNPDRGFWAVRDVTLDVPAGTTFGLIGHNGSGKSTLLRLMAGIHQPSRGSVATRGRISALLELGSGFHPDLTGRENIYLNGAMLGINRKEMHRNLDQIVDFSGLEEFIDQPVKVYSSGMYVRLGFAVAVHVEPEVLLVDEVMAVGDEEFQRRCLAHMYSLRREGVTIVFVSHSLGLVQTMCETVAWLDHGKLMELGPAVDVCESYLDQVNADEAERRTAEMIERDDERAVELIGERSGSGEIRVYHVDYLNPGIERIPHFKTGEAARLRFWYDAAVAVDNPILTFDVFHENGTHVFGFSTRGETETGHVAVGQGFIDYVMDEVRLSPGHYYLGVELTDGEGLQTFDSCKRLIDLKVVGTGTHRGMVSGGGHFDPIESHNFDLKR
ncbi:MAG: ABC transporter ATP-binding protein, partial [Actinomycetia bacterium]|nr:ABC transporter ATP-binding protein [Actinomycetes bacterium]